MACSPGWCWCRCWRRPLVSSLGSSSVALLDVSLLFWVWLACDAAWSILAVRPFTMQEYSAAGQFNIKGKVLESIKQNLIFYGAIGVCGIGFLIWIVVANNIGKDQLPSFMFTLATTFGLLNIVLMLGYGLVEVPRMVWRASNPAKSLARSHYKAPDLDQDLFDARCVVEELIGEVCVYVCLWLLVMIIHRNALLCYVWDGRSTASKQSCLPATRTMV